VGGIQQTNALYNNYFLDSSGIGIVDANDPYLHGLIQGKYTAVLQAGLATESRRAIGRYHNLPNR
jgi:hypothetical protein